MVFTEPRLKSPFTKIPDSRFREMTESFNTVISCPPWLLEGFQGGF